MRVSAPFSCMMRSARTREPLPDTGRSMIREINSLGIPANSKTGPKRPSSHSMAPEAVIASMPIKMAMIKGRISTAVVMPSLAPSAKRS